jgi:hypothetical protein
MKLKLETRICGFHPADEEWHRMNAVWEACKKAKVPVPQEVEVFFNHRPPFEQYGVEMQIPAAVREFKDDVSELYEVDLSKLPQNVKIVRFYHL